MATKRRLAFLRASLLGAALFYFAAGCAQKPSGSAAGGAGATTANEGSVKAPDPSAASADAPTPAPDFALQSTAGGTVRLSELKGKVVLVDFWATWCAPCRASIPHIADLYNRYKGKGVEVVGIADDTNDRPAVAPFVRDHAIPYTVVYGDGKVGDSFGGIIGYPTLFVINRQGQVVKKIIGYVEPQQLEDAVSPLL